MKSITVDFKNMCFPVENKKIFLGKVIDTLLWNHLSYEGYLDDSVQLLISAEEQIETNLIIGIKLELSCFSEKMAYEIFNFFRCLDGTGWTINFPNQRYTLSL